MNSNFFPKLLLIGLIGTAAFIYFDPLRPTDREVKAAILAGLLATDEGEVATVNVSSPYGGQRVSDGFRARLWPVTATVMMPGKREHPYHDFVIWKSDGDRWLAAHNDPKDPEWKRIGLLGWGKFGL
jgi:hypothetical protein